MAKEPTPGPDHAFIKVYIISASRYDKIKKKITIISSYNTNYIDKFFNVETIIIFKDK